MLSIISQFSLLPIFPLLASQKALTDQSWKLSVTEIFSVIRETLNDVIRKKGFWRDPNIRKVFVGWKIQFIIHFYALVVHLEREKVQFCVPVCRSIVEHKKIVQFFNQRERERSLLTISALKFIQRLILMKNRENITISLRWWGYDEY